MAEVETTQVPPEAAAAVEPAPEPAEPEASVEEATGAEETPCSVLDHEAPEGENVEPEAAVEEAVEPQGTPTAPPDHKRKYEELEVEEAPKVPEEEEVGAVVSEAEPAEGEGGVQDGVDSLKDLTAEAADGDVAGDVKRQRLDEESGCSDGGQQMLVSEVPIGNGHVPTMENLQPTPVDKLEETVTTVHRESNIPSGGQHPAFDGLATSRKIEVPNNKVGVLIGKAGETIRFLQFNSGAKIQITRDADADPHSSTRSVELTGSFENINKAEKLIKDVIAEAVAGGSPSLVARGFGTSQPGVEQLQIQVPNEKVGLIIGKGGETIKGLQTRSGARIQLIPQHAPEGEISKERTVRITGNKEQIEAATEMIKEVMSQVPMRSSTLSGGYTQHMHRPRGPAPLQWGPRAMPSGQSMAGYGYQQRGAYPSQAAQYPPPAYGGYAQQPPPRSSFGTGWDQRPSAPIQTSGQVSGYDYYGQGGHPSDAQTSAPGPVPSVSGAPTAPANYYGQSQVPGYGQQAPYPQSAPSQGYGHGYDESRYDNQAPTQQVYGQQPVSSQPGVYPYPSATPQSGYAQQQPYNKPSYEGVPSQGMPQSYGHPRPTQPGDSMYQGSAPYGPTGSTQQQPYPYGSTAPSQQAPGYTQPYAPPSGAADGYAQYSQQGGQAAPVYGQGAQSAPAYTQGAQSGGYGQYPSSQPTYGDQAAASNVSYGYQGGPPADTAYGNSVPASGYGVPLPAGGQTGYTQPSSNPSGYEQPVPAQAGYGNVPGSAPVGYAKSLSPQPGYGQYESTQMYAQQ